MGNRPEARPLSLDVLDHYQLEAIEHISGVLWNAMEALQYIPKAKESADLDYFRASNTFFLSGEAGGGKTTVYLSLREGLKKDIPPSDKLTGKLHKFRQLKSRAEQGQLVWLEPLDLESAPEVGNFLAAVLVRIADKIGKEAPTDTRRRGLLEQDVSDALQEYAHLQHDVVLAWEGNIPQRAEHLDPEVFSMEVLNAAKASTKVKPRLQRALESIFAEEGKQQRLFVLPIDDFYLHPSSSLKLLRLLRMIAVPQLFALVMGDLHTVEELVYQDTLGKLVALAGEQALSSSTRSRQWEFLSSTATVLSANSLRKLIPMGQRYYLAVMHRLGALRYFPEQLDAPEARRQNTHDLRYTLKDLLGLLPVKVPLAERDLEINSLLDFLRLRSTQAEGSNDDYYTYSGLAVLDLPPREVVDLWCTVKNQLPILPTLEEKQEEKKRKDVVEKATEEEAKKLTEEELAERERERKIDRIRPSVWKDGGKGKDDEGWNVTLKVVADAAREAIFGQTYISKEDQDKCAEAVRGPRGYSKKAFATGLLNVTPEKIPLFKVALGQGAHLQVYLPHAWFFHPRHSRFPERYLAPRPTAWLTVLHDLMSLSGEDRLAGDPLTPDRYGLGLVEVNNNKGSIAWPTPRWSSFWHFDRLCFAWRRAVNGTGEVKGAREFKRDLSPEEIWEWLAFHWIKYCNDILLSNRQEIDGLPQKIISGASWRKLAEDTKVLIGIATRDKGVEPEVREMVHDWLVDLAAMLSGLQAFPASVKTKLRSKALDQFSSTWKLDIEQVKNMNGARAKTEIDDAQGGT